MKVLLRVLTCLLLAWSGTASAGFRAAGKDADPIAGKWLYRGKYTATFAPDGTTSYPSGLKGIWKALPTEDGRPRYGVVWEDGRYVEEFHLSADEDRLDGIDTKGRPFTATRVK